MEGTSPKYPGSEIYACELPGDKTSKPQISLRYALCWFWAKKKSLCQPSHCHSTVAWGSPHTQVSSGHRVDLKEMELHLLLSLPLWGKGSISLPLPGGPIWLGLRMRGGGGKEEARKRIHAS